MPTPDDPFTPSGGCDCGLVRYRLASRPLFVHCCHCRWCQRESGSAFALNALIETERVEMLGAAPELVGPQDATVPLFDTTRLHALSAAGRALEGA